MLFRSTHKLNSGQLVVLPSLSLLVDFREQQRRRGGRGNEVYVIDKEGAWVEAYSAPHLSTPCCLAEPRITWKLYDLPDDIWTVYLEAGRLVDKMKGKISKVCNMTPC